MFMASDDRDSDEVLSTDSNYCYLRRWPGDTKPAQVVQEDWDLYQEINKQFGRVESWRDCDRLELSRRDGE